METRFHPREPCKGWGVVWIALESELEFFPHLFLFFWNIKLRLEGPATQVRIVGLGILRVAAADNLLLLRGQPQVERIGNFQCRLFLNGEDVLQVSVEILRPDVEARRTVNELRGDAHAVLRFAHAPFQNVAHAQFAADLLCVFPGTLEPRDGTARGNLQVPDLREFSDDFFGRPGLWP